jgi:hypothetical protein
VNQFSFRSRIRLGLILLITCSGLIWSSGFISANASEDQPQNLNVVINEYDANVSWSPGQWSSELVGYVAIAYQAFISPDQEIDTAQSGFPVRLANTENLSPGGWEFYIKAIYADNHESSYQSSEQFSIPRVPRIAHFVSTTPEGEIEGTRTIQAYDNDPLIWPAEPVINSRNPRTGAKFLGWMNSSNEIVPTSSSPIENMTYTQSWEIYPEPLIPFEIQIDETILTSEELANSAGNFYVTWEDDQGSLPISISLVRGVSSEVTLRKIDPFSLQIDWSKSADLEPGESEFILGSDEECIDSDRSTLECSDTHYLTIRTDSEDNGYSFGIFLIRQHVNETKRVTYHLDNEALVEEFEANDWSSLYEPVSYSNEHISLAKWCKEENPSQLNEEDLRCRTPDEFFAVTDDLDLYPLWIDSLIPDEISIGDQVFDSDDWIADPENNFLYLTVIANDELPLSGEINFKSVFDLIYEPEDVLVEDIHGEELIYIEDFGYELSPGCLLPERCSMIYQISPNLILEEVFSSGYALMLIVTNSPSDTFTVDYDLSNQETISEELELGWHEVPDGNRSRSGYESSFTWANNVGGQTFEWETYFPVIEDETLTLLWIPTNDQNSEQANENSNQNPGPEEPNQSNQPTLEFPRLNDAPITNTPLATNNSTNTDLQIPQKEIEVISSSAINSKKVSKRNGRIEIRASLSSQYSGKVAKLKIRNKGKAKRITLGKIKLNKKANGKFPPISYAYAGKKVGIYVGGKEVFSFVLEV